MKKILIIVTACVFIVGGFYFLYNKPVQNNSDKVINSVTFSCSDNKKINALLFSDKAELTLSDGRTMLLSQAISASGARYTNSDESFVFWNKGDTAFITEGPDTTFKDCSTIDNTQKNNQMANPASVNCVNLGGNLSIEKNGAGAEYGLCYFEDNRACEEWALMRGDCPVGGMKTTGFDSIDQKYCAWSGGQTFAVPNSICTFKNGSKCSTESFYNGTCSQM